jgi:hypothetical protein
VLIRDSESELLESETKTATPSGTSMAAS